MRISAFSSSVSLVFLSLPTSAYSATLEVVTPWKYSVESTRPITQPFEQFQGPTYTIPGFSSSLGSLNSASVKLDGNWKSRVTSTQEIEDTTSLGSAWSIHVNEGQDNSTLGTGFMTIESVGAFSVGQVVGRGSGEFTSTGRTGRFPTTSDTSFQLSFASSTASSASGPRDDGITATGEHSATGIFTTTYDFSLAPGSLLPEGFNPVVLNTIGPEGPTDFVSYLDGRPMPTDPVGFVENVSGEAVVVRNDGTIETIIQDAPILQMAPLILPSSREFS